MHDYKCPFCETLFTIDKVHGLGYAAFCASATCLIEELFIGPYSTKDQLMEAVGKALKANEARVIMRQWSEPTKAIEGHQN